MIVEKVFYFEDKKILDREELKRIGFKYEPASSFGEDKKGWYIVIKADEDWFKSNEKALKGLEEVKEKEKILKKFRELEENVASGIGNIF